MYETVIYHSNIVPVGGVETFLYELAKLSNEYNRDLTIIYRTGDAKQIRRLRKYCRVLHLSEVSKPIRCKTIIFNYNIDAINDFEAETYAQIIHANFKEDPNTRGLKLIQSEKITQYYAVSQVVADAFTELTGVDADVLYNPITVCAVPRVMTLVSAQRMCEAKGSTRIEKIVTTLDRAKLPYVWHIFSDTKLSIKSPNIMYHEPSLDVRSWIQNADYLVLISDSEGFSYGLYESLSYGTPVITTPLPILKELGANKNNSIIVDFDLSNLNVQDIYSRAGTFKFEYRPKSIQPWLQKLTGVSTYTPPEMITVECTKSYYDMGLNRSIATGEMYEVTPERANIITQAGYAVCV